jgi:hypothetical protein
MIPRVNRLHQMWIDPVLFTFKGAARGGGGGRAVAATITDDEHKDDVDHGVHTRQGHFSTNVGSFLFSDMGREMG